MKHACTPQKNTRQATCGQSLPGENTRPRVFPTAPRGRNRCAPSRIGIGHNRPRCHPQKPPQYHFLHVETAMNTPTNRSPEPNSLKPELRSWDGKREEGLDRQRGGKAAPEKFCTRWLQARRARSDAPYRAGRAAGLFGFIAHFGVRVKPGSVWPET